MKACPYCGKEYPEEETLCAVDYHGLVEKAIESLASHHGDESQTRNAGQAVSTEPEKIPVYPEYKWKVSDAWKCMGMLFIFTLVLEVIVIAAAHRWHHFTGWRQTGFGVGTVGLVQFGLMLITTAYFARTDTLSSSVGAFALNRKPTEHAWFGIAVVLLLRVFTHFAVQSHWSRGLRHFSPGTFRHISDLERFFYLVPVVVFAPLFEEVVNRGFLYKAFRTSYGVPISVGILILWTALTHFDQYSQSGIAVFSLSAFAALQCILREKSDSLWDCILCHFVFNASAVFLLYSSR